MASSSTTSGTQKPQQIDRLAETAHGAIDRATQTAQELADRFGDKSEEFLQMKDDYVAQARDYVKENPFMAVGIALAAGYLFGKISSWR
jgi:ElaB/YqjD/DUF883 family membrane-anchored ribosome-binding protein